MKMFKDMSLDEAHELYLKLKKEKEQLEKEGKDVTILKQSMDNLVFFTCNFEVDY